MTKHRGNTAQFKAHSQTEQPWSLSSTREHQLLIPRGFPRCGHPHALGATAHRYLIVAVLFLPGSPCGRGVCGAVPGAARQPLAAGGGLTGLRWLRRDGGESAAESGARSTRSPRPPGTSARNHHGETSLGEKKPSKVLVSTMFCTHWFVFL